MVKKSIILDLCGGTGAWSDPWRRAGYGVMNITLPQYDVRIATITEEFITFHQAAGGGGVVRIDAIKGILAAPPCTEFSRAKQFHGKGNYSHDFAKGLEPVIACLKIIAMVKPDWWAMENPNGYLQRWMGTPTASFEPWQYGEPYQKTTLLWGAFKMPPPTVSIPPKGLKKFSMLHSKEIAPQYFGKYDRTVRRSITPAGFAEAFFKANR